MIIASEVKYSVEAGLLLLGFAVLLGPILAERLRIPGLIGLIAMGTIMGPYVLEWLRPGGFVATVGAAGLLYLMFVAGVELDLKEFMNRRTQAVSFGLLTFAVPFALSLAVGIWYLDLGANSAALVGAMWASHTLVAYPEAKAAGLDRNPAVGLAVAATVITDVLSLVVLAVASSSATVDEEAGTASAGESSTLPLWLGLGLLVVFCFVVVPKATTWMFAHVLHARTERFMWALTIMAAGGVISLLGGVEGLVGAFLAGLGINRNVPGRGELMERIEFFGSALFVPAFLVSVGLSIDPAAAFDPATLWLAVVFTAVVVVGKSAAAGIAGLVFGLQRNEVAMMTALTIGQAAATLAVAQVGISTGLFDEKIFNAAVVAVVFSVLITSFGTRAVAKLIGPPTTDASRLGDHVVAVAPATAGTAETVARLATAVANDDGGLVTPLAVATKTIPKERAAEQLESFEHALVHIGHDTDGVVRVAATVQSGVTQLAEEAGATALLLPVPHERLVLELGLGDELAQIGATAQVPCIAVAVGDMAITRVVTLTGDTRAITTAEDTRLALDVARRVAHGLVVPLHVLVAEGTEQPLVDAEATFGSYRVRSGTTVDLVEDGDLLVVPAHVVADAGLVPAEVLRERLEHRSVMVVADIGRLASVRTPRYPLAGMVAAPR
ncbi:MAG: cation:proton antiporter [Ilumatobacter sp.]|nr:cation:proton antiporter [Ilumatobacter sp.]